VGRRNEPDEVKGARTALPIRPMWESLRTFTIFGVLLLAAASSSRDTETTEGVAAAT
jgi:hypothetical protein